ncbi:F-box/LRR-repeat protein 13-like [Vicia villosa]|uniref:F-box/LRR-repeat protein 13-like n=1 Tax=Vicia villosa TaxID=3911 RepID=UPI00273BC229|nr:F-box/LRR-repeat protein 13-like [Vicia villosa]
MSNLVPKIMIPFNNGRGMHDSEENRDRLSDLPDCLLLHILSYLNSIHAVQTCILSTRWRHLWKHIPTVKLKHSTVKCFDKFLSKMLTLRDNSTALRALDLDRRGLIEARLLEKILNYVYSHNAHIQQLEISVVAQSYPILNCISSCKALTSLKLSLYNIGSKSTYAETLFPKSLNLPLLTTLYLENFTFCGGENGCAEPFSIFTKLNSLVIRHSKVKKAQILSISNETLVDLAMHYNSFNFVEIELSTPSLCTFTFPDNLDQKICGSGLSCVKHVSIYAPQRSFSMKYPSVLLGWLRELANVESLKVTSITLQILFLVPDLLDVKLHSLCNLKSLDVELIPLRSELLILLMKDNMLKKFITKSHKEVVKLREAFKLGMELPPIPDGIVDFLLQNSPSAQVNITTKYEDRFNLKQVEESVRGERNTSYLKQFCDCLINFCFE